MGLHRKRKSIKFTPDKIYQLMKKDEKNSMSNLEVDVKYPKALHKKHDEPPFLAERIKTRKVDNLKLNLRDKNMYVIHIKNGRAHTHQTHRRKYI